MNRIFLISDREFTYQDLLTSVNATVVCRHNYQESDLFLNYSNFIKSLVHNLNIVLIDSDLTGQEIKTLGIEGLNTRIELGKDVLSSHADLIEKIKNSKSEITFFTSGTTGQPKRVTHTISTLTKNTKEADRYSANVWGFAYNATHVAGIQVLFQSLFNGNCLIDLFNKDKEYILDNIETHSITHISATPTFYRKILDEKRHFPSVKRVTFGGEKSDNRLQERVSRMFPNCRLNNIYASTELGTLLISKGEYFQIPEEYKSLILIQDDELIVHKSLAGKFEVNSSKDEFYHTGDIVEWVGDDRTQFKFIRRKNDLINVGGYNVNPSAVEEIVLELSGIKSVVVYGRANSVLGNILCCDIVLTEGTTFEESDIRSFLSKRVQNYNIPRFIKFVEEIKTTRTGKVKRV